MLFIGVAILVIGHQFWLWARGWQFNALSPYFLCDLMIFALIGLGSLVNPLPHRGFFDELLFCSYIWTGILAYYFGLHLKIRFPSIRIPHIRSSLARLQRHKGLLTLTLLAGLFLFTFLTLNQRMRILGVSIGEMITLSATQIYSQVVKEQLGALPVITIYVLNSFLLIQIYQLLQQRLWWQALVIYASLNLSTLLIASTRMPIIMTLSIPIAYYHYAVRRINLVLILSIMVGGPIALTLLHGWRGKDLFAWTVSDRLAAEAEVMKSFYQIWQKYTIGELKLEYGANYFYYSPLSLVPRSLWAEKPQTSFETRWTINLFGSLLDEYGTVSVHTFTPWGEGMVQFGWLGSLLNLFLYGLILRGAIKFFICRTHACLVYFFFSILSATFIRTSVQALLFTALLYIVSVWLYERWFFSRELRQL